MRLEFYLTSKRCHLEMDREFFIAASTATVNDTVTAKFIGVLS